MAFNSVGSDSERGKVSLSIKASFYVCVCARVCVFVDAPCSRVLRHA